MRILCKVKLSEHKYKTPEGYLYCKDAIIARTGKQTYLESEVFEGSTSNDYVEIDRSEKEVFSPETMASFENKPLTIEHPDVSVGPENYKDLSVGHIQNVRKGEYEGQPVMMADIMVNDAEAIRLIESGEMTELSCGYDCDITSGDNPEQINIRGNHVALCEAGRAGIAMIVDSKPWGIKSVQDSVNKGTLIQEFGKQGKQYKIVKIVGNVIYAENLTTEAVVLFKKDEENIEWAVINKSDVKDTMITYWKPEIGDEIQIKKLSSGLFRFKSPEEKDTFDAYVGKSGIITDITKYDENYHPIKVLVVYDNGMELECFIHELEPINNTLKRDLTSKDSQSKATTDNKWFIKLTTDENGNETYLDINDKPTNNPNERRYFDSKEEAEAHCDTYCKGEVCTLIEDEASITPVIENTDDNKEINDSVSYQDKIKELLKDIKYKDIEEDALMLTINFDDKTEMKKAGNLLKNDYDIELVIPDLSINVYDKLVEDNFLKDSEEWAGFDLLRGPASKDFKQYLRDRGLYFEPSSNGDYVHFEVKNADEDVYKQVDAIREHWGKFHDSYSKKFYSKMIKELEDRLKKLEKNELLDENNHTYEKQKNSMREEIKKQIEEYKQKLTE